VLKVSKLTILKADTVTQLWDNVKWSSLLLHVCLRN